MTISCTRNRLFRAVYAKNTKPSSKHLREEGEVHGILMKMMVICLISRTADSAWGRTKIIESSCAKVHRSNPCQLLLLHDQAMALMKVLINTSLQTNSCSIYLHLSTTVPVETILLCSGTKQLRDQDTEYLTSRDFQESRESTWN